MPEKPSRALAGQGAQGRESGVYCGV